jgi:hypothetical protein
MGANNGEFSFGGSGAGCIWGCDRSCILIAYNPDENRGYGKMKKDSAKMNRGVNSTFRNISSDGVRIESGLERGECRAFPAWTRKIRLCRCKFLLSSTEV